MIMDADVLARYRQKVKDYCGGIDPYDLKSEKTPLPRNVGYFDVYHYCIGKDSAYMHDSFRAYKSLEAFEYFENGFVQSIKCKQITTGFIVVAKVKHSYRFNLKLLCCWVAIDNNGIILTAHCKCMAGLGEVCTHVGAVLFVLEAWNRKSTDIDCADSISCTDVLAKWLVPKLKAVEMASVVDICWNPVPEVVAHDSPDNTSIAVNDETFLSDNSLSLTLPLPTMTNEDVQKEIDDFLHKLKANGVSCPLMAIGEPFSILLIFNFFLNL